MLNGIEVTVVTLKVDCPTIFESMQQGYLGNNPCPFEVRSGFLQVLSKLADFRIYGARFAIRCNKGAVHLFLPTERAAPLPVKNSIRAMPDGVPCHCPRFAPVQRRVHVTPVNLTG